MDTEAIDGQCLPHGYRGNRLAMSNTLWPAQVWQFLGNCYWTGGCDEMRKKCALFTFQLSWTTSLSLNRRRCLSTMAGSLLPCPCWCSSSELCLQLSGLCCFQILRANVSIGLFPCPPVIYRCCFWMQKFQFTSVITQFICTKVGCHSQKLMLP